MSAVRIGAGVWLILWLVVRSAVAADDQLPPITALAISPSNEAVVVGSQAGLVIRSWPGLEQVRELPTELVHIHDLAFAPDGKILAAAGGSPAESGEIELYHWPSGKLLQRSSPHDDLVSAIAWRADSKMFAAASVDKSVTIHQRSVGERQDPALVSESKQGTQVTLGNKDVQVAEEDQLEFKLARKLEGHSRGVLAAAFLPGDFGLITAGIDESLRLWNVGNGQLERTLTNHTRQVYDAATRPGASETLPVLVSVGEDGTVRLWQATIGRLMRFTRLNSPPLAVTWTSDGAMIATSCKDGALVLIDPDTAEVVKSVQAIDGLAYCLAASSDGSMLVGGQNGQLKRLVVK